MNELQDDFSTLFELLPVGAYRTASSGRQMRANLAMVRIFGFETEAEMLATLKSRERGWYANPSRRAEFRRLLDADGVVRQFVSEMRRDNGQTFWISENAHAVRDSSGQVLYHEGTIEDVTARVEAEASLIAARDAAQAAAEAKAQFLANMSHEIRTPMNAVVGMTDLLMCTDLSAEQQAFVETIRTSGDMLLALINNILDFSKIDAGHLELEHQPVHLGRCLNSALQVTSTPARLKGLDLHSHIDSAVPEALLGDVTRLRQVLVNLISNAVKFTAQGEIAITLSMRAAASGAPLLYGSVRDTGIGIAADRLPRLFRVFSQVDASTTRHFGGTGLGLAICHKLVAVMGGQIWAESTPGVGSNFQFTIPCEAAVAPLPARAPGAAAHNALRLGQQVPLRILLVEDNLINQRVASLLLTGLGYDIEVVGNGQEALDAIASAAGSRCAFDVLLLDLQMPVMDGLQTTEHLCRQHAEAHRPWIIALTANALDGDRQMCLAAGMDDYLSKPIRTASLSQALQRAKAALEKRRAVATI